MCTLSVSLQRVACHPHEQVPAGDTDYTGMEHKVRITVIDSQTQHQPLPSAAMGTLPCGAKEAPVVPPEHPSCTPFTYPTADPLNAMDNKNISCSVSGSLG